MKYFLITICILVISACSTSEQTIILNIEDGSGLSEKTDVVFKGKKIGSITEIIIVGNKLIAKITIPNDFKIYKNSEFYIISTDILGGKSIEIINPEEGVEYNSEIIDTIICKAKPSKNEILIKEILNTTKSIMDTITQQSNN